MAQSALLEFESAAFAVVPGEDKETNPGIYGKALAQWLAEQLRAAGLSAGEIIPEDFGWCVPVASKPHSLHVDRRTFRLKRCRQRFSFGRRAAGSMIIDPAARRPNEKR